MLGVLKSEFYRLFHGRLFWACLLVFEMMLLLSALMLTMIVDDASTLSAITATSSDTVRMVEAITNANTLQLYGQGFVSGSWIVILSGFFVAIFFSSDFRTGSIKNYMQIQGGRIALAIAGGIVCACVALLFVVAGIAGCEIFFRLGGFSFSLPGLPETFLWIIQVWLVNWAYVLIVYTIACMTKSTVCSAVAALLLGGYALENILGMIFSAFATMLNHWFVLDAIAAFFNNNSLMAYLSVLSRGSINGWDMFAVVVCIILGAAAIQGMVMRRRSLA